MTREELEREYDRIVDTSHLRGETESSRINDERRRFVRLQPDAAPLEVQGDPWIYLINVSRSGLAFYTDTAHAPGTILSISLDGGMSAQAKVVECLQEVQDPAAVAGQYRVCCEFIEPETGLRFFLALKALEAAHLDIAAP